MRVYVFGNRDYGPDSVVFGVVDNIEKILRQSGSSHVARSASSDDLATSDRRLVQSFSESKSLEDRQDDKSALKSLADLSITFVEVRPNEDLPFVGQDKVVIMDVVMGLDEVAVLTEKDLDRLELAPRTSAHEFDLGWQLKYLKKLGKLGEVRIVGLPWGKKIDMEVLLGVLSDLV